MNVKNKLYSFKLVLLGESAVGKSTLVTRFAKGQFFENQETTIGAAFLTQTVSFDDITVKLEIWDTAGQEKYHSLAPLYYRNAPAAIVVFDLTSRESFNQAKSWVNELQKQANSNVVIGIAGNKSDLASHVIDENEAKSFAIDCDAFYMQTSAKTGHNVNELFLEIAKRIPKANLSEKTTGNVLKETIPKDKSSCFCSF